MTVLLKPHHSKQIAQRCYIWTAIHKASKKLCTCKIIIIKKDTRSLGRKNNIF